MFPSLRQSFSEVIEPFQAIRHGSAHYQSIITDDFERNRIALNKFITDGTQFVSSCLILASAMPMAHPVKQSLIYWGRLGLVLGFVYAIPLSMEFLKYGREGLKQQEKLKALSRQP